MALFPAIGYDDLTIADGQPVEARYASALAGAKRRHCRLPAAAMAMRFSGAYPNLDGPSTRLYVPWPLWVEADFSRAARFGFAFLVQHLNKRQRVSQTIENLRFSVNHGEIGRSQGREAASAGWDADSKIRAESVPCLLG